MSRMGFWVPPSQAAAAWTPASLGSSLLAWWDPSDGSTITASGSSCTQLADKSGNGNHLVQSFVPGAPLTGTRSINGLNVIEWTGSSGQYELACTALSSTPATSSMLMVVQLDSLSGTQKIVDGYGGSDPRCIVSYEGGPNWQMYAGSFVDSGLAATTSACQLTTHFSGSTTSGQRLDGSAGSTGNAGSNALTSLRVGILNTGSGQFFDGVMAEWFITNTVISGSDLTSAEAYLKAKWGTP